jgi:AcrR family transcriptional regulator
VSHTAPYRHFPDKAALLATLAEDAFVRLQNHLRKHTGEEHPPLEALRNLASAYVSFAQQHAADFRVMFGPEAADKSAYPGLSKAAEEAFDVVRQAIVRGQEGQVVRRGDPTELALVAWSLGHGLAVLVVNQQLPPGTPPGIEELADRTAAALYAGLQPARPRL